VALNIKYDFMSEEKKIKKGIKIGKRVVRPTDLVFWVLIVLLLIPSTRSVIMGGVAKVRTAIFTPALKVSEGPVLDANSWAWKLVDLNGSAVAFDQFKGDIILVNSWATWCPPCRAEMPSLENLYKDYGNRISMILVSNEETAVVKEFVDKKGYTFPVYISAGGYPQAFSSKSIPATFILNRDGQVVYQRNGAFDWNSKKVKKFIDKL